MAKGISLDDFAKSPLKALRKAKGRSVAVKDKKAVVFYCVPRDVYVVFAELTAELGLEKQSSVRSE